MSGHIGDSSTTDIMLDQVSNFKSALRGPPPALAASKTDLSAAAGKRIMEVA